MIEPLLKDESFLGDVRAARAEGDALHLWWLGQSGFLVHHADTCVLLDPYLSDSLTKKYAATDKPHVRMTARVIAPEKLDFIDVVTSSHNHTDHLDAETLLPLRAANPALRMIIPDANRAFVAERLGCDPAWPVGLDDGQSATVSDVRFTAIPSAHETVERDEAGRCRFLGYIVRIGRWTIYHSGDTVLYDGMAERIRPFAPDLALLPINGAKPERRVAGNLDGREAARLAHDGAVKLVVPCHYEMFEFNTASPDEFVAEAKRLNQPYRLLRAGERLTLH
ncbi:MAG TPA: MBL fold metallo-hydrolase [Bryobacteraceae bacterium]|nr:MBL fold metallo-hydrolase [Bryobacteraceae bacterium]